MSSPTLAKYSPSFVAISFSVGWKSVQSCVSTGSALSSSVFSVAPMLSNTSPMPAWMTSSVPAVVVA